MCANSGTTSSTCSPTSSQMLQPHISMAVLVGKVLVGKESNTPAA
jgi:hypothetical protein